MTKSDLEQFYGKNVIVRFADKTELKGIFYNTEHKIFEKHNNIYLPKGFYVIAHSPGNLSCVFRSSQIRKISEVSS